MSRLRLGFMGTPEFAVAPLRALAGAHEVVQVVSQPDRPRGRGLDIQPTPVKAAALEMGLVVAQPEKLDSTFDATIAGLGLDVLVVVAYGKLLKPSLLSIPRLGCVNIHASILPRWRGAAPIQWAIAAGDPETGVSTMLMEAGLDTGPTLEIRATPIGPEETASALSKRLSVLGASVILSTLEGLANGRLSPRSQEGAPTYAHKLTKEMSELDVNRSALELDRKVRAFDPWPGTSVRVGNPPKRLKILSARAAPSDHRAKATPGSIRCESGRVLLATGEGDLELLRVQWEGKKPVGAQEFIAAWKD